MGLPPAEIKEWEARQRTPVAIVPPKVDLRDKFAMAALTGLMAYPNTSNKASNAKPYAVAAYAIADAMLAERQRNS